MKWVKRLLMVFGVILILIALVIIFTDLNNTVPDIVYASM